MQLDQGNYKGSLHFVAEFVPGIFLKGVSFDAPTSEIRRVAKATQAEGRGSADMSQSSSDSKEDIPLVTVSEGDAVESENEPFERGHAKGAKSMDTVNSVNTAKTAETTKTSDTGYTQGTVDTAITVEEPKYEGAEMAKEALLKQRT